MLSAVQSFSQVSNEVNRLMVKTQICKFVKNVTVSLL